MIVTAALETGAVGKASRRLADSPIIGAAMAEPISRIVQSTFRLQNRYKPTLAATTGRAVV